MLAHLLCTLQLHLPLPRNQLQFRKWPLQWFLQHPWHTPKADLHSPQLVLFLRNLIPATSYWRNMNTRIYTNEIWEFRCRCRQSNLTRPTKKKRIAPRIPSATTQDCGNPKFRSGARGRGPYREPSRGSGEPVVACRSPPQREEATFFSGGTIVMG